MKQEMENVIVPATLNTLRSISLHSIDRNIQGMPTLYAVKGYSLSCAGIGEIFDAQTTDDNQRCGE